MVVQYSIAGRQVGSHVLAMATLGITGAVAFLSTGGNKASKQQGPPIKASSGDEENFIKEFIKKAEAEEKKAKA